MRKRIFAGIVFGWVVAVIATAQPPPPRPVRIDLSSEVARGRTVAALREVFQTQKSAAEAVARERGWAIRGQRGGATFELMRLMTLGRPIYNITANRDARVGITTNLVQQAPYNLRGQGFHIGVWDDSKILATHQEFGGRATQMDGAVSVQLHMTNVAGTIGAAGVHYNALGMAPEVLIDAYDWGGDIFEMADVAANQPAQPGRITISNHSYGTVCGWDFGFYGGFSGWFWFGTYGEDEDATFGQYWDNVRYIDEVCYEAPYYLPFVAAGNDRGDNFPGGTFYYFDGTNWVSKTWKSNTDPPASDGWDNGFDTLSTRGIAKNVICVGATQKGNNGDERRLSVMTVTTFSSFGPTDDGRIKPDIMAAGLGMITADASGGVANVSGTSFASPAAAGSALLLVQLYDQLFPGQGMLSSTLKGLILHTADDIGNPGPDYSTGWGVMDTQAAADHLIAFSVEPGEQSVIEGRLDSGNPSDGISFVWNRIDPIRATICWTDPPGENHYDLDDPTPVLVNDLDLRITGPGGTHQPFILNPANPGANATRGDNFRDNVEQVLISSPASGIYTLTISHKGTLSGGGQTYSLILSGHRTDPLIVVPPTDVFVSGGAGGPFTPSSAIYTVANHGNVSLSWQAATPASWLTLSQSGGTLAPGATAQVTVSVNSAANLLPAGHYVGDVVFTNVANGNTQTRQVDLSAAIYWFSLDTNPGWLTEGLWAYGTPLGQGSQNKDPNSGYTGTKVYGYNLAGDYQASLPRTSLTTPAFNFANYKDVTLNFWRWLGVESSTFDHASVEISSDGANWTTVWDHAGSSIADLQWKQQSFDISAVADGQPAVYLRWVMGATDSSVHYPGWNIDDILIRGTRLPDPAVAAVNVMSSQEIEITFNRPMGSGVTNAANYAVSGGGRGSLNVNPAGVAPMAGNTYRLQWAGGEMKHGGDVTITVAGVFDAAGNPLATPNSGTDAGGGIGSPPQPQLDTVSDDPTAVSPILVSLTFDEAVTGVAAEDIVTSNGVVQNFSGAGDAYAFELAPTAEGVVSATLPAGAAVDAAGNPNGASNVLTRTYAIPRPEATLLENGIEITDDGGPIDFGGGLRGEVEPTKTFELRNDGDAALVTANLLVPEGYAIIEGLAGSIAPTGSDTFTVALETLTTGTFAGTISFETNDTDENPYAFAVTGEVIAPRVQVTPESIDFGARDTDDGPTGIAEVIIVNRGTAALNFTGAGITLEGVGASQFGFAEAPSMAALAAGTSTTVALIFDPAAVGITTASLQIVTDDSVSPIVSVPLSGTGTDQDISVSTASLIFGIRDIDHGATEAQVVTITNEGTAELTIAGVEITGAGASEFSIVSDSGESVLNPQGERTLEVTFDPSSTGAIQAELRIASDDTDEPETNVSLIGTGTDQEIFVSSSALDFGEMDIAAGSSEAILLSVMNTGTAPLSFIGEGWSISGADAGAFAFETPPGTMPLDAGSSRTVALIFDPADLGIHLATLRITTDDADEAAIDISLSGNGTGRPEIEVMEGLNSIVNGGGSVNFVDVEIGATAPTKIITVRNIGSDLLMVSGLTVPSGYSVAEGLSSQIPSGGFDTFTIQLATESIGNFNGTASFETNDGDENPFAFSLSGTVTQRLLMWVDFAYSGESTGTESAPFASLMEAVAAVPAQGTIRIKGTSTKTRDGETGRIVKPIRIEAHGGAVRIGAE